MGDRFDGGVTFKQWYKFYYVEGPAENVLAIVAPLLMTLGVCFMGAEIAKAIVGAPWSLAYTFGWLVVAITGGVIYKIYAWRLKVKYEEEFQ